MSVLTSNRLLDVRESPGIRKVFGTDETGVKDWQNLDGLVQRTAPLSKTFASAQTTWTWNHNLGFRPMVEAYDLSWVRRFAYVVHDDANTLRAEHNGALTGHLLIR